MAWEKITYNRKAPNVDRRHNLVTSDQWAESGRWVGVSSSNVRGIRYDEGNERLFVEFKSRAVYAYEGVQPATAEAMFRASSMGRFVWQRLRGQFPYRKLWMPRQKNARRRRKIPMRKRGRGRKRR